MNPLRKKRLYIVMAIALGTSIAIALALYALKQNINLYYTPTQVAEGLVPKGRVFRVGGMIKKGSIQYSNKDVQVNFMLTDHVHTIQIQYSGILPDLFRAGQGIVTQGRLNEQGIFSADQVLAKHSAKYMPPAARRALKQAKQQKQLKRHNQEVRVTL